MFEVFNISYERIYTEVNDLFVDQVLKQIVKLNGVADSVFGFSYNYWLLKSRTSKDRNWWFSLNADAVSIPQLLSLRTFRARKYGLDFVVERTSSIKPSSPIGLFAVLMVRYINSKSRARETH